MASGRVACLLCVTANALPPTSRSLFDFVFHSFTKFMLSCHPHRWLTLLMSFPHCLLLAPSYGCCVKPETQTGHTQHAFSILWCQEQEVDSETSRSWTVEISDNRAVHLNTHDVEAQHSLQKRSKTTQSFLLSLPCWQKQALHNEQSVTPHVFKFVSVWI